MAGRIPKPGRISLNPMLTKKGKLYGDLTVACIDENEFMIFGSGAAVSYTHLPLPTNREV